MNKILIIGSTFHENADTMIWSQSFSDIEKYNSLIIDLTSFPKDYPPSLFNNIATLKRTARIFIQENKEIYCIMEKPIRILFKKIPLNYSWMPFPQKLTVTPMLLGLTIKIMEEEFSEYLKNVEKWDNKIYWKNTPNTKFSQIAINKNNKPIAGTITLNQRGKIHFLPKATKINQSSATKILVDLALKKEPNI